MNMITILLTQLRKFALVFACLALSFAAQAACVHTATITPSGPTTFCNGDNVQLNANLGAFTYQWLLDGAPLVGSTAGSLTATLRGNYQVVVTAGGCSDTSAVTRVTVTEPKVFAVSDTNNCPGDSTNVRIYGYANNPAYRSKVGAGAFSNMTNASLQWTHGINVGSTLSDLVTSTGVDQYGNIIAVGEYRGTLTIDGQTITSAGDRDVFIAKFTDTLGLLWIKSFGGAGADRANSVAIDNSDNSYVTGFFEGNAAFGGVNVVSNGGQDVFVAQVDDQGNVGWVHTGGSAAADQGIAIDVKPNGVSYVTGWYTGAATFGAVNLNSAGSRDVFVTKLSNAGVVQWSKSGGGTGVDQGIGIGVNPKGGAVLTGRFSGTFTFDALTATSQGNDDIFTLSLAGNGNANWVEGAGSALADERGRSVVVDANGNAYVTGFYKGTADFSGQSIVSSGARDAFLAKYNANGGLMWLRSGGGIGDDKGYDVALDNIGHVYISGYARSTASFNGQSFTSAGGRDHFVAVYDVFGTIVDVFDAGGGPSDIAHSISLGQNGDIYIGGEINGNSFFDALTVTSAGGADGFLARLSWSAVSTVRLPAGPFSFTVEDASGCTATETFTVDAASSFEVNLIPDPSDTGCVGDLITNRLGASYDSILWNDGSFADTLNVTTSGTVFVTVRDTTRGCVRSDTAHIFFHPIPSVSFAALGSVCVTAPAFALSGGSPVGGVYSGTGVAGGNFDPGVAGVGTFTITYTYTDGNGCSNSTTRDITVTNDVTDPVLANCPSNITRQNSPGNCFKKVNWTPPTATDNCAGVTLTSSHNPGASFPIGTTTVTYTATDAAGNAVSCSFDIIIKDREVPVIANCPANITQNNDIGNCSAAVTWTAPTASDNCAGVTLTSSHNPGDVFPVGTTTVTYTATDASGNTATCTFDITVNDTENPAIANCPTNITQANDIGNCSAAVTWTAPTASDNCAGVTLTSSHNPGDVFPVGTTTVTYTATDAAGNTATCTFDITVNDSENPAIANCPSNITQGNDVGNCSAAVTWTAPTASDNCAGVTLTSSHNPGDVFPVGTTTVTYTATDAVGNTATCTFDITVNDTENPAIANCPSNITQGNDVGNCSAAVTWTAPTASDNCAGVTLTSSHNPGDVFPVGTTTVTYTATDAVGNTATCTFDITVNDTENPAIANCPSNITQANDIGNCSAVVTWTAPIASDNCAGVTLTSSHNPGDVFPVGTTTVTYTATDAAGNTATCTFDITVNDTENPAIANCPSNITQGNDVGNCSAAVTWTAPTASDNCAGVTLTSSHNPGDVFPVGTTTVTYTATDAVGNTATCTFDITVNDTENPSIANCPTNITQANDIGNCSAAVTWTAPTASDNCAGVTLTSSHNPGDVFPVGTTTVTYTATDAVGNTATCTFDITVNDTENPAIANCPSNITQANDIGNCSAAVTWIAPTASDNCAGVTLTSSHNPGDVFPVGTTTVTYTATDAAGNTATCTFDITVNDTENPAIANCLSNITQGNDVGNCSAAVTWTAPTASDNCAGVTLTSSHNPGDVFPVGTTTVTYTATDAAGNNATCTFDITVNDTENPAIANCPTNITQGNDIGNCSAAVTWTAPTASDNCAGVTLTSSHNPGDVFPVGTTTVTYTATDAVGNTATCSFDITVNDTENPAIANCPSNITQANDIGNCSAVVTWTAPTASDNCAGVTLTSSHNPGDVFPAGMTTVTYTATDAQGNTATCSFNITVEDRELPVISCPADINVGKCQDTVFYTAPVGTDNCIATTSLTSGLGSGSIFPIGTTTETYTVSDTSGNSATCTFDVTVHPLPIVTLDSVHSMCTNDTVVVLQGGLPVGGAYRINGNSATNFDPSVAGAGQFEARYVYVDAFGCTDSASRNFDVFVPTPVSLNLPSRYCADTAAIQLSGGVPTGGIYTGSGISNNVFKPYEAGRGSHTVTYTFVDTNRCTSSVTENILIDSIPIVAMIGLESAYCESDDAELIIGIPGGGTYTGTTTGNEFNPSKEGIGSHIVTYVFSDNNSCSDTAIQEVEVHSNPVINGIAGFVIVRPNETYTYTVPANNGSLYFWEVFGGTIISQSNNMVTIRWGAGPTGVITVIEQNKWGCEDNTTLDVDMSTTAVLEHANLQMLQLYPNPTQGKVVLSGSTEALATLNKVEVYSATGAKLMEQRIETTTGQGNINIDISALPSGVYFVGLVNDKETVMMPIQRR